MSLPIAGFPRTPQGTLVVGGFVVILRSMVKIYSILLILGFLGILAVILGGTLAENLGHPDKDPNKILGTRGRLFLGGLLGFSMGGIAAEFSPLDFSWQAALAIAVAGAVLGVAWVGYANRITGEPVQATNGDPPRAH